jgi:hypothetical protein
VAGQLQHPEKRYTRSVMTPESPDGEPDPARPWEIGQK